MRIQYFTVKVKYNIMYMNGFLPFKQAVYPRRHPKHSYWGISGWVWGLVAKEVKKKKQEWWKVTWHHLLYFRLFILKGRMSHETSIIMELIWLFTPTVPFPFLGNKEMVNTTHMWNLNGPIKISTFMYQIFWHTLGVFNRAVCVSHLLWGQNQCHCHRCLYFHSCQWYIKMFNNISFNSENLPANMNVLKRLELSTWQCMCLPCLCLLFLRGPKHWRFSENCFRIGIVIPDRHITASIT